MKIAMIGTGYVGLTTGTCLADLGNDIICVDIDEAKIEALQNGDIPIYEPGLRDLVERNVKANRLSFTTDAVAAIKGSDIIFVAVGTPQNETGEADLKYVFAVAETIGKNINGYKVIVNKSTVPVGTAEKVKLHIKQQLQNRKQKEPNADLITFDVASNPEFLREGEAIKDFMNPDRVVIGAETQKAKEVMIKIYKGIERVGKPIIITDVKSAELIKYAANAMLASRISFMNQIACLAERVGADIKEVAKGMGLDRRIGPRFLQAGVGYGGSCFPKDVRALTKTLKEHDCQADLLEAIDAVNERQKKSFIKKAEEILGDLQGTRIAIWGIAFKPKTDDIREAPSLILIQQLLERGANVQAFDPVAEENARKVFGEKITYGRDPYTTLEGCDCLIIVTEWDEFRYLDKQKIKAVLKQPNVIDGRNIYDPKEMKSLGFKYLGVGRQ
jgi:UDPglucose 6-dehydrogenase